MHAIRMLEDAEGSVNGHTVHLYKSGEVYSSETTPPVNDHLMQSFVVSGRAVEVDAQGNPVGTPADRRAYKAATEPPAEPAADEGANSPLEQRRRGR